MTYATKNIDSIILQIGSNDIIINNVAKKMDATPIIRGNRTMVPVRFVFEVLGGQVYWNSLSKKVKIVIGDKEIELTSNNRNILINGIPTVLDVPIEIFDNRTYMPLKVILEKLNFSFRWEGLTKKIYIFRSKNINSEFHEVKYGDYLIGISTKYNITVSELKRINNLSDDKIYVGQKLYLNQSNESSNDLVFYSQKNPKWENIPYTISNDNSQTIGTSGCGPSAMAIVVSSLTRTKIDPIKACELSIKY